MDYFVDISDNFAVLSHLKLCIVAHPPFTVDIFVINIYICIKHMQEKIYFTKSSRTLLLYFSGNVSTIFKIFKNFDIIFFWKFM